MKATFALSAAILIAVTSLAGCSKKESAETDKTTTSGASAVSTAAATAATAGGSCTHSEQGMCIEYPSALSPSEAASEKKDCEKDKGTWGSGACPAANLLGTCTNAEKGAGMKIRTYKGAAFASAAEAKKALCSSPGDAFAPN
jgi:hypothetical protein